MTQEPKDVQLARMIVGIIGEGQAEQSDLALERARQVVDAHEANIEAGRKQAEERQRAIDETARRWTELKGWRFIDSDCFLTMSHDRNANVYLSKTENTVAVGCDGDEADASVILALIDAAGRNTTADRLREAMREANECLDNGCQGRAGEVLRDALLEALNA